MNRTQLLACWCSLLIFLVLHASQCETGSVTKRISALWNADQLFKRKQSAQSRLAQRIPTNPEVDMSSVTKTKKTKIQLISCCMKANNQPFERSLICTLPLWPSQFAVSKTLSQYPSSCCIRAFSVSNIYIWIMAISCFLNASLMLCNSQWGDNFQLSYTNTPWSNANKYP